MNKCLFAVVLFFTPGAYAREKKGYSHIDLSYCRQNYRDNGSMQYDGLAPDGHIHPRDPDTHYWGLRYVRVTRYGISVAAEFQYGVRRTSFSVVQDMTNFDPAGATALNNYFYSVGSFLSKVKYVSPKILIGYTKQISKKTTVTAQVGVADKLYTSGSRSTYSPVYEYKADNGKKKYVADALTLEQRYGRSEDFKHRYVFSTTLPTYELYIGMERRMHFSWLRSISVGLEGSRGWWMWGRHEIVTAYSSPTINQIGTSKDVFIDRNISIGLRVAVGFWK